jgi:hypothetical protein
LHLDAKPVTVESMDSSEMGKKGGAARAKMLSAARRREIARLGGQASAQARNGKNGRKSKKRKPRKEQNG